MSSENKTPVNIVQVLLGTVIGVLIILGLGTAYLSLTNNTNWDLPNWITLLVEVGVGVGIAGSILVYERNRQQKFEKEQEKISELIDEIKKIEEKQQVLLDEEKKLRTEKIIFVETYCGFYLDNLKRRLNELKSTSKNKRQFKNFVTLHHKSMLHYTEKLNERKKEFITELSPVTIRNIELITEEIEEMSIDLLQEQPSAYDDIIEMIEEIFEEFHKSEETTKSPI